MSQPSLKQNFIKATHVNVHAGTIKSGPAKGEQAKVIDYSTDHGKTWINHGIYCRQFLAEIDRIKQTLLQVGAASSREELIFPRDCDPDNNQR